MRFHEQKKLSYIIMRRDQRLLPYYSLNEPKQKEIDKPKSSQYSRFPISLIDLLNQLSDSVTQCVPSVFFLDFVYKFDIEMIKNRKVQRMLFQNNIEQDNYTLILRLKSIIGELKSRIQRQEDAILNFKKDVKTTKINQMEIEIMHLNDQNKRLQLLVDELRGKPKTSCIYSPKKTVFPASKAQEKPPKGLELRCEGKLNLVLQQNENLKRELLSLKCNDTVLKKRKSTLNDRNSMLLQKNLIDVEKWQQKKLDLQAEKILMHQKIKKLELKIHNLENRNQELENTHYRETQIQLDFA